MLRGSFVRICKPHEKTKQKTSIGEKLNVLCFIFSCDLQNFKF